jgi:VanZ family protein
MPVPQPPASAARARSRWKVLDLRYSLPALAYLGMMFWLPSRPALGSGSDVLVGLAARLYHVPLYAGLGFFVLLAISRGQALAAHRWARAALTLVTTGAVAVLTEWYRTPLPGRDSMLGNLLPDLAGVAGLLLVCGLGTAGDARR